MNMMKEVAALDPRLADLVDTIEAACQVTAHAAQAGIVDDLDGLTSASFMHGFVTAARLAEQDSQSLSEIMILLRHGPMKEALDEIDRDEFTQGLRRHLRRSDA